MNGAAGPEARGEGVGLELDLTGVATVSLQDVAGQNAMSERLVTELSWRLKEIRRAPQAKIVVLKGLPRVFSGGASRELLVELAQGRLAPADIRLPMAILDLPVPVIAAMEGDAIGGGFALGLCADIVLIARASRYGCSFMNMGFTPGMGTTRLLEHVLAPALAHEMLFTGQWFRGVQFEGRSGFNYILPRTQVLPKAAGREDVVARVRSGRRSQFSVCRDPDLAARV